MPFVDLPGGPRLHYVEAGQGEPLVAVHGFLGTARRHLGRVLDWLSARYHTFGPTLRGYGPSAPQPRDFPPDFYRRDARDVLAFMDALRIERAHLLGYSDGGEVALIAAGTQPERFRSVAVWGAPSEFGPAMRALVTDPGYPARLAPNAEECALHGIPDADAFARAWIAAILAMIDSGDEGSLGYAERIGAPLLVMLGGEDRLNPQDNAQRFVDRAPDGRLVMFEGGHAVHDLAWNNFQRVLGDFLAAV